MCQVQNWNLILQWRVRYSLTDIFPNMMQERAELWYRKEYIWGILNEKTVSPNVKSIRVDGLCAVLHIDENDQYYD